MSFDVFLNFDGDCRQALEFYAEVFQLGKPGPCMTYGDAPGMQIPDEAKDRVLYATLPVFGSNMMFSDCPPGQHYVKGTNIALTLGTNDAKEIERLYNALKEGGMVNMELGKTFFSELYAMVTDKFGITWQLSKSPI